MKPLHKLGKYHNLEKLNKIATDSCFTDKFPTKHNYVNPLYNEYDYSYTLWATLGVEWHVDDIYKDKKYSIILVVESANYELYASSVNNKKIEKLLKTDCDTTFRSMDERIDNLLVRRKNTQRLILKAGDILLLDISYYHKLENTRKTENPFIFISLDIDFIPKIKEAVKVVNYFVYDFL
ncbi:MAG: hypothetical protein IM507_13415 [Microcystis sp. M20BS1]|jgi:hypothetical protein|uniref:hypothetical protein n=1 Tax=Microcystis sp. M20BS1 TaxID=2771181 RepID=UPI00257E7ECC|nr:hypothetical protein [Microcystis sp. M20BS1]MCA2633344.1 hypothetical protein [Microcystis sp. M20BS1]